MSTRTLRIIQVGVAPTGIGVKWLSLLSEAPDWELVGVVDIEPERRARAIEGANLGADRGFASIVEAASRIEFDAAAVIAPSPLHAQLSLDALQAGKHVIVEKPFAIDVEQARAVVDLAEARGLQVMVDQNYRYLPDIQALRRAVQTEVAGAPAFATISFNLDWPPRTYQATMANTMLLEMAIHHLDSLRFVLGADALAVTGQAWRPPWTRYQGDTWVTGSFTFPRGVRALYNGSLEARGAQDPWQGVWRIECERGALHLADHGSGFGLYLSRAQGAFELLESFGTPPDPGSGISGALAEFAAALREGRRPRGDGRDNLQTLAMAFGLKRSSDTGLVVELDREQYVGHEAGTQ
jgi:predicted dehydrogenase